MGLMRLFLALVVANAHFHQLVSVPAAVQSPPWWWLLAFNSVYAVFFFYMISGFLITYTLTRNYEPNLQGTLAFYRNRFVRIFSLYWPVAIVALWIFPGAWSEFVNGTVLDKFTGVFLLGADWNLGFAQYPKDNWNALIGGLHQAWTLGAELTFYLLAPFLVRSWRAVATLFLASLLLRAGLVHLTGPRLNETWAYYFTPSTFLFFMAGQGVCLAANQWAWLRRPVVGYVALIMTFAWIMARHDKGLTDVARLWIAMPLFALSLPGLFEATKRSRVLNYLGNLSYPLYLTHALTMAFVVPVLWAIVVANVPNYRDLAVSVPLGFLAVSVVAAMAAHHLLEKPFARLLHYALARRALVPVRSGART